MTRAATIEERREAAAMAMARERRNRPIALLVGAAALLIAAGVFAGWSLLGVRAERADLRRQESRAARLVELAREVQDTRNDPSRRLNRQRYAPETNLLSKLQRITAEVGLERPAIFGSIRPQRFEADSILVRNSLDVTIAGAAPEVGLAWLERAGEVVPGLHVLRLRLTPDAAGWGLNMSLARWEISE